MYYRPRIGKQWAIEQSVSAAIAAVKGKMSKSLKKLLLRTRMRSFQ